MKEEIQSIINKNLPAEVGEILRKRLEHADKDAAELKEVKQAWERSKDRVINLESILSKHADLDSKASELRAKEKELATRESNQKVFEAELKCAEAEKRANELSTVVMQVFKSPVYRKQSSGTTALSTGSNGSYYASSAPVNDTTIIEEQ